MLITNNPDRSRRTNDLSEVEDLTLLWSCKEAVFKWYGLGEVDFKGHIVTKAINPIDNYSFETIISFEIGEAIYLDLHSRIFIELPAANFQMKTLILSYVTT